MVFKVGDYVKCIDDSPHKKHCVQSLIKGSIYLVDSVITGYTPEVQLNYVPHYWLMNRFILATKNGIDAFQVEYSIDPPPIKDIDYFSITKDIIGG